MIPHCLEHQIGLVPFSPIASGFLSGKVTTKSDFSHSDDVRKFVPQLQEENPGTAGQQHGKLEPEIKYMKIICGRNEKDVCKE